MVHALPFFIMLMIYALWRGYMLGIWVGGYGHSLELSAILWLPVQLFNLILGTDLLGIIATVFVISLLIYALWRHTLLWLVSVLILPSSTTVPANTLSFCFFSIGCYRLP